MMLYFKKPPTNSNQPSLAYILECIDNVKGDDSLEMEALLNQLKDFKDEDSQRKIESRLKVATEKAVENDYVQILTYLINHYDSESESYHRLVRIACETQESLQAQGAVAIYLQMNHGLILESPQAHNNIQEQVALPHSEESLLIETYGIYGLYRVLQLRDQAANQPPNVPRASLKRKAPDDNCCRPLQENYKKQKCTEDELTSKKRLEPDSLGNRPAQDGSKYPKYF